MEEFIDAQESCWTSLLVWQLAEVLLSYSAASPRKQKVQVVKRGLIAPGMK